MRTRVSADFTRATRRCVAALLAALAFGMVSLGTGRADEVGRQATELSVLAGRFEEPLVATSPTTPAEDAALLQAIRHFEGQAAKDDFRPYETFLSEFPNTGWRVALLTNLGFSYYENGFFSRAIDAWSQAWQSGRNVTDEPGKALVDRAVGELLRMHARLGHADELTALFADLGDRRLTGPATETMTGANEGLWAMRNDPGVAYLCGPMALKNLLIALGRPQEEFSFLDEVRSGPHGVTLAEVGHLAERAHLEAKIVRREPGEPVPVPSIVHWKINHFAAIVAEEPDGQFRLEDPTFGRTLWISRAALDAEASGYFLVPGEQTQPTWREARPDEIADIRGMGYTGSNDPEATRPSDAQAKPDCGSNSSGSSDSSDSSSGASCPIKKDSNQAPACPGGMCGYNFTEMTVSLVLRDIPVGYTPPKGPSVKIAISYNQREASQPANFSFSNVSPKWTFNWLSFITDNPNSAGSGVSRYVAGGGNVDYAGFNSGTGAFTPETFNAAVLVRTSANPITYQRKLADGSIETYAQSNGATSNPRKVFLSKVTDPVGNSVSLNYDSQLRLVSLTDATGRSTTFTYGIATRPLLITQITDPFGRSALLGYDATGRLSQITDVLGLTSQFTYDSASLVNALTTPYGTTKFSYGDNGNSRFLTATDPLGYTERLEYQQNAPGIPFSDPASTVPKGILSPFNQYLTGRDTFYWDKHAYAVAAGDYTKARNKHWTHLSTNTNYTSNPVESIKYPFENRIWFNYYGQAGTSLGTALSGTLDKPIRMGRVLDDGTTQLAQMEYNSSGRMTSIIDPVGRQSQLSYATNGIDLTQLQQKTSAPGFSTIAQLTYNNQHLPLTYVDAAGQTTSYAYNAAGQRTSVTNALGQTTSFQYDGLGYLVSVTNANGATKLTLTYDTMGRVATRTDSEGFTISYSYDALDRVTREGYADGTTRDYIWSRLDLTSVKDRQNRVTSFTYDAVRNLIAATDPLGQRTQLGYFENQQLKTLTDSNGNATTWSIDVQGRMTAKTYADNSLVTNTYESTTSRLKTITDAMGQKTQYTYALDNRPTAIQYLNAVNATPSVGFSYDAYFPRVTAMTDSSGTTGYAYQAIGTLGALQLAQENGPYANTAIAYVYDALGRVTSRSVGGNVETYGYDALGRLTSHVNDLGTFALGYLGQTSQMTSRSNGVVGTNWSYDTNSNDRRLLSIVNSGQARGFQYTTTPEYDISSITESIGGTIQQNWSYGYDTDDRLTNATSTSGTQYAYGYDQVGNIPSIQRPASTTAVGYNALNQITSYNGVPFTYDKNGNLLADDLRTYTWDAANRLVNVAYKAQPGAQTALRYDGRGRRLAITTSTGSASTESRYLWCGDKLCQSRTSADQVIRRYFEEGEEITAAGTLLYYAVDHLGSVRDVLTAQSDSRVSATDFEPYGGITQSTGRVSTDYKFAKLFYNQQSGLFLANYRGYDPRTGEWLSRDPLFEAGGLNLHGFVANDPIGRVDPLGLQAGPQLSPNFLPPTNPPQSVPTELPPGFTTRVMGPAPGYPNGYFVVTNPSGQPVDISNMKPPSNVTRAEFRSMTHVELPPEAPEGPLQCLSEAAADAAPWLAFFTIIFAPSPAY